MRLDDAITYFLGQWPSEGPTQATVSTYGRQLKWFARFAAGQGKIWLADLTPELLRTAMAKKLAARGPRSKGGEASAHSLAFAARCMASWLHDQGMSVADLTIVKPRKPPERVQPRLQPHEFQALEGAILRRLVDSRTRVPRSLIARDLALIYLMADTGLRASEICGMDVRNVDFDLGAILVVRGKGRKERALSIVDPSDPTRGATLRLLADWIETRRTIRGAARHPKLWVSFRGRPLVPRELWRVLARICLDAGLGERRQPHAYRRANFTEGYLAQPTALRVLADRMGWSPKSHQMIDIYTRGAEVDLARTTHLQPVSTRLRGNGPKVPVTHQRPVPILSNGAGPPRGVTLNDRAMPRRRGKDTTRPPAQPHEETGT